MSAKSKFLEQNTKSELDWLEEVRKQAFAEFSKDYKLPKNDENWRYSNFRKFLKLNAWQDQAQSSLIKFNESGNLGEDEQWITPNAELKILARYRKDDIVITQSQVGAENIRHCSLAEALSIPEFKELISRELSPIFDKRFDNLSRQHLQNARAIIVEEGVGKIEIRHIIEGENLSFFPIGVFLARKNAKMQVVETYCTDENFADAENLICGRNFLLAEEGSHLNHVIVQNISPSALAWSGQLNVVKDNAELHSLTINISAKWARCENVIEIEGKEAKGYLHGVNIIGGSQEYDSRTLQVHHESSSLSSLLFKNILFDESRNIFSGLIKVKEGAHYTDAYQTCKNLLLSENTNAVSMPGLEINADQVKCSHGATTGQIDAEDMHYMQSRGLPKKTAQLLLATGFASESFEYISDKDLRERLRGLVRKRMTEIVGV